MAPPTPTSTLDEIATAISQIAAKKTALRLAFDDLVRHRHFLSSTFPLDWLHIDSHFSSLHSSLLYRLQSLNPNPNNNNNYQGIPSQTRSGEGKMHVVLPQQGTRNELFSLNANPNSKVGLSIVGICEAMDAGRLRDWLRENAKKENNKEELIEGLKGAEDRWRLVMVVVEGFGVRELVEEGNRGCVVLLEALMEMMGEGGRIGIEVRERARRLGGMWREELRGGGVAVIGELAFLEMVVGFGIGDEFDKDDLMGFVKAVLEDRARMGRIKIVCRLCRMLGLEDKAPELVRKLVQERKQLMAVKFVHEMNLTDKYPLVPLLKSYLNEANKDIKRARRQGNKLVASGDITPKDVLRRGGFANSKEMAALKAVHQYIKNYNLEAEYPIEAIEKKIRIIEEQKAKKAAIRALGSGQNVQKKEPQPPKIQKEVQQPSTHLGEKPVPTPSYQQSQPPEAGFAPEQRAAVPSATATSLNSFSVPASSSGPHHYEPRHLAVRTDPVTSYQPPHQQQPQSHLQEPMYPMEQQAVAPSTSAVGPYGPGIPTSGFTPYHYGSYGGSGIPMGYAGRTLYSDPQTNGLNSQQGLDVYAWSAPPAGFGDQRWQFPAYAPY